MALSFLATNANTETVMSCGVHRLPLIKANISSMEAKDQEVPHVKPHVALHGEFFIHGLQINFLSFSEIIFVSHLEGLSFISI